MRFTRMVAGCVLVMAALAFNAIPRDPPLDRKDSPKLTLWELDQSVLFPALRQFVDAPGTKPDRQFVPVEKQNDGTILFTNVPKGWFTWKDDNSEGRVIVLDQDGFRVLIRIEHMPSVEKSLIDHIHNRHSIVLIDHRFTSDGGSRVIKCARYKGDTHFIEYRYLETGKGAICVTLTVFDWPKEKRTLDHLLVHLRSHYGKYEGVCQQVAAAISAKP